MSFIQFHSLQAGVKVLPSAPLLYLHMTPMADSLIPSKMDYAIFMKRLSHQERHSNVKE